MSQAFDLAVSIASGLSATPGIVHDPHSPLVIGHPETGEFLVLNYDPVTRTAELSTSSDDLNLISTLSFDPNGNLLINGQPLASVGGVEDAVSIAQTAAAQAEAAATAAAASALTAEASAIEISTNIDDFLITSNTMLVDMTEQADRAEAASSSTDNIINESSAYAAAAAASAATAASARDEASARAAADPDFVFTDGTKSARGYANDAALSAQQSRAAVFRMLTAANFPETFAPGTLFTRARVQNNAANVVTVGPGIWTNSDGEAWATYRLESAGSVKFQPVTGTTTTVPPSVISSAPVAKNRADSPTGTVLTHSGTVTPPNAFTGRVVVLTLYTVNGALSNTAPFSFSGGISTVIRRGPTSPGSNEWVALGMIHEGTITNWPGGALNYSIVFTPPCLYVASKAYLIGGGNAALTPISAYNCPNPNASSVVATPLAVPAQSLILGVAGQRRPEAVFTTWGTNMTLDVKGSTLGAPPAPASQDSSLYRNMAYGFGTGLAAGAGDFAATANFQAAVERCAAMAIAYQPGTGIATNLVDMIFAGGRDTLNVPGDEAELWFAPDGKTVFVQIPKP